MTLRHVLAVAALLLVPHNAGSMATDPTHGYWLTENGKAIVELSNCGGKTCGRMVWIDNPRDETGDLKRDVHNTDANARARTLCGLTLVGNLRDNGRTKDGWIYNPRNGETYSVAVEPISEEQLKIRGFLGIKLFGSSQIWTRVSSDRGGCRI